MAKKPGDESAKDPKADPAPPAAGDDGQKADPPAGDEGKKTEPVKKAEKTFTKAELEAERQKAVAEAKAKWDEEKDLTELDRLKKENEDLRNANRLRDARDEVSELLRTEGNKSPALAFEAIKGQLQFDDKTGKLTNAKDLIANLKTSYPEQFGTEPPADGVDAGAGGGQKKSALTIAEVEKMTPAEVNSRWDEVSKVMAEGK